MPGSWDVLLFVVFPYVSVALFIAGLIYGGIVNPLVWTTRSSQFFEQPAMGAASLTFHWGIILLFIAHLFGLAGGLLRMPSLIDVFFWLGLVGGVAMLYGATLALARRVMVSGVRAMSAAEDYIILALFIAIIGVALYLAVVSRVFGLSVSVAPWLASVFTLRPDASLMAGVPLLNKIHITLFFVLLAYWPYTKLVHLWAFPWRFITRPYIAMRMPSATPTAPRPGAPPPRVLGEAPRYPDRSA